MILRAAQHRRMPWKNGGGETTEIAVFPEGAGLDDFHWRVSMARVAADGPFSAFEGVDRTLAVLSGEGLRLLVAGAVPVDLRPGSPPHAFPGDAATEGRLLGGPITDLNVMTRRGQWAHQVHCWTLTGPRGLPTDTATLLWLCVRGRLRLQRGGEQAVLERGDAWLLPARPAGEVSLTPDGQADLALVMLKPLRGS